MAARKKKTLGRGMSELVEGTFSSIVEPAQAASQPVAPPAIPAVISTERGPAAEPPSPPPATAARPFDVVSVTSGKGGTGKSVLTSNLGVLLAGSLRVTLLDADLGLANLHILYGLIPRYNASHVISGARRLEEIQIQGPRGVTLIPGGSGIPELANLSDAMFGSLVSGIASLERSTDLLLIDTPSGIDRQSLIFLLASDQVLVVTTDDITAMTDAYAVIKTVLTRRPEASVVVVVNQARSYAGGLETFQKIAHVARKFLGRELTLGGVIPFDEIVERSVTERTPVVLSHPAAAPSRAFGAIAARIGSFHARPARPDQPFVARLRGLLGPRPRAASGRV